MSYGTTWTRTIIWSSNIHIIGGEGGEGGGGVIGVIGWSNGWWIDGIRIV